MRAIGSCSTAREPTRFHQPLIVHAAFSKPTRRAGASTLENARDWPTVARMDRWRWWRVAGLLALSACGARSGLIGPSEDTSNAPHFGGAVGIGGAPNGPLRVTAISAGPQNTCGV